MKLYYKSLLASLLLCMPLGTIQAAAEIGPNNIYQILSGIEDLQDGSSRTLDQVQELVNETIVNTNFIQVMCAMPAKERTQLLNDFNITLEEAPQDDDYSEAEDAGAGPDGEVPRLPEEVLELLLLELGFVYESGKPLTWLCNLPQELIALILNFNSQYILELADAIALSELSEVIPVILSGPDGSPLRNLTILPMEKNNFKAIEMSSSLIYCYDYQGTLIKVDNTHERLSYQADEWKNKKDPNVLIDTDEDHDHALLKKRSDYSSAAIDNILRKKTNRNPNSTNTDDSTEDRIFICSHLSKKDFNKHIGINKDLHYYLLDNKKNPIDLTDAEGNKLVCASINLGPKGQLTAVEDQKGHWHLFDNQNNSIILADAADNNLICASIHFGPEGQLTASEDPEGHWHLFDNQHNPITLINVDGNNLIVNEIKFCPDGQLIAARDRNRLYHLFDCQGNRISLIDDPNGYMLTYSKLEFSLRGTYIAVQDLARPLTLQEFSSSFHLFNNQRNLIKQFPIELSSFIFSPDEQYLCVISTQDICYLYNIPKNQISILTDIEGNPIRCLLINYITFSCDGHCLLIQDIDDHCHLFTVTEHKNIQYQLRRGITTDTLLLLKLLAGLKENWEEDYFEVPFATCPADITCALISPLLSEIDFKKVRAPQTIERIKQIHTWVIWALESLKKIQLTSSLTLFDVLYEVYTIEDDPVVRHSKYETNGLIAPGYLIPYVRLRNENAAVKIQTLTRGHQTRKKKLLAKRRAVKSLKEDEATLQQELQERLKRGAQQNAPDSFFTQDQDNESDYELFGASTLMEID